jgi:hypothetical protein
LKLKPFLISITIFITCLNSILIELNLREMRETLFLLSALKCQLLHKANNWEVAQLLVNDIDSTSKVPVGYIEAYTKEHIVDYYTDNGGGSSTWRFRKDYSEVDRGSIAGIPFVTLRVTGKSFLVYIHLWYTYTY